MRSLLCLASLSGFFRNHVWSIIAAVALLRRLRYWLKKILRALRLQQAGNSVSTHCLETLALEELSYYYSQLILA